MWIICRSEPKASRAVWRDVSPCTWKYFDLSVTCYDSPQMWTCALTDVSILSVKHIDSIFLEMYVIFLINYFGVERSFRNVKFVYSELMLLNCCILLNVIKKNLSVTFVMQSFCPAEPDTLYCIIAAVPSSCANKIHHPLISPCNSTTREQQISEI